MKKRSGYSNNSTTLTNLIDAYFKYIEGEYHIELIPSAKSDELPIERKTLIRDPEPATITGLALYLGFDSRDEFNDYEQHGKHAALVKRARLRVEAAYEKKLHSPSPSGPIFALKSIGWNEKAETSINVTPKIKDLKVRIIESGPQPANNEKEVALS